MRIQMARLKWAMVAVVAALAVGGASDPLRAEPSEGLPRTVEDLPALEKSLHKLYVKVAPSTVNLFVEPKHEHVGSGVVIDAKGLVLTHAHQRHDPGTRVSVGLAPGTGITAVFPDGKKAQGKVLGVHEPFDLSLFQLEGDGPWPAIPLGDPARLKSGDTCVMLGYPKLHHREGEPPLLRLGRFLGPWGHYLLTSCNINGGDSGGPLLTLDGKLLGNNNLIPTRTGTGHTSVEYFQRIRPELLEGRHVKRLDFNKPSGKYDYPIRGPFEGVTGLDRLVTPARDWLLTVLDGNKPVALGVVVDGDGWVVTKASELPVGAIDCQLIDGRKVKAVVAGRDRDHDLALLKLPIGNLSAAKWSDRPLAVGQVLAATGPAPQPLAVGVVACAPRQVPSHDGFLSAFVFDGVVLRSECGGPLVGGDGKLAGLVIARIGPEKEKRTVLSAGESRTYAIPADVVQKVVAELRRRQKSAEEKQDKEPDKGPAPQQLSFPGDVGTPEHERARELVVRLGSNQFQERNQAEKQLNELGAAALVALREGTRVGELEVQRRCQRLVPKAQAADWVRRADAFEKDTLGKHSHGLPLQERFEKRVGASPGARSLFAEMVRREGVLLELAAEGGDAALKAFQARCTTLERDLEVSRREPGSSVSEERTSHKALEAQVAAISLASMALKETQRGTDEMAVESPITPRLSVAAALLLCKDARPAFRKLIVVWLESHELKSMNPDAVPIGIASLHAVLAHRLTEALPMVEKIAGNEKAPPWLRAFAVEVLAKVGARSALPALEKLFETPGSFTTRGNAEEGTVGDHALGQAIRILGLDKKDFSLKEASEPIGVMLPSGQFYEMRFHTFATADERRKALERWSADKARRTGQIH